MPFQTILLKSIVENAYLADISDAILNFSKRSMMTECHHPELCHLYVTMTHIRKQDAKLDCREI